MCRGVCRFRAWGEAVDPAAATVPFGLRGSRVAHSDPKQEVTLDYRDRPANARHTQRAERATNAAYAAHADELDAPSGAGIGREGIWRRDSGYAPPPASRVARPKEEPMSEYDRTDRATDELRDEADDAGDAVKRGAHETKESAKSVADRVSDAVEDMIPGDSDRDGH